MFGNLCLTFFTKGIERASRCYWIGKGSSVVNVIKLFLPKQNRKRLFKSTKNSKQWYILGKSIVPLKLLLITFEMACSFCFRISQKSISTSKKVYNIDYTDPNQERWLNYFASNSFSIPSSSFLNYFLPFTEYINSTTLKYKNVKK